MAANLISWFLVTKTNNAKIKVISWLLINHLKFILVITFGINLK